MDYKKVKTDKEAITRTLRTFDEPTGNIYETVAIYQNSLTKLAKS